MVSSAPSPGRDERWSTVVMRPRTVRIVAYGVAAVMLGATVGGALLLTEFSLLEQIGLVMIGVLAALFCHLQASVRLVARPQTLTVHNLMRSRTLEWAEVIAISFPKGDPWAHLDLADGSTLATMAVQRTDGARGIENAHRLAALVRDRGEAPEAGPGAG